MGPATYRGKIATHYTEDFQHPTGRLRIAGNNMPKIVPVARKRLFQTSRNRNNDITQLNNPRKVNINQRFPKIFKKNRTVLSVKNDS
jgi:hypothetical protein